MAEQRSARYDQATLEQAVLTVLFEMRALIDVFEDKGLLRRGEVSERIRAMKEMAAGTHPAPQRESGEMEGTKSLAYGRAHKGNGRSYSSAHDTSPQNGKQTDEQGCGGAVPSRQGSLSTGRP